MSAPTLTDVQIHDTGKTRIWSVDSNMTPLGQIRWYSNWRRYCFFPSNATLFDRNCLEQIIAFIDEQMRLHKEPPIISNVGL